MSRTIRQDMDVNEFGRVLWVVSFIDNNELMFSVMCGDMTTAREAGRRWLVGTANTVEELEEFSYES